MLRKLLLRYLITAASLFAITIAIPGINFFGDWLDFLKIVTAFFLANLMIKPFIKVVSLPVEIATLGLFSIIINAAVLWGLAYWLPTLRVTSFWFSGLHGSSFVIAPIEIPAFLTAVLASVLMGFISTVLYWLTK